jgi:hypothetical protein
MNQFASILVGTVIIGILVPFMQWLDRGVIANSMETQAPNPLGVGMLVAFVAVNALLFSLVKKRIVKPVTMLILYVMLTVAVPFCSVGVIAPLFGSLQSCAREMYWSGRIGSVKHVYDWQNSDYFPKLSQEGYESYLNLQDPNFIEEQGIIDPKDEVVSVTLPIKQFWSGADVTQVVKDKYANDQWSAVDRARASWGDIPWSIWRNVVLNWGAFLGLIFLGMMLLAQLLHVDWTQRENLPFPVAQLPLALMEEASGKKAQQSLLKNAFFLGGMGVAGLLLLLSGLAHYRILDLPLSGPVTFQRLDFSAILVQEPFSFAKNNYLFLSPLLIGIGLLVHQDILRGTLWVFFGLQAVRLFVGMTESSLSETFGTAWPGNQWPYYPEIGAGAAFVFVAVLVWRSRAAFSFRRQGAGGREQENAAEEQSASDDAQPTPEPKTPETGTYFGGRYAGILLLGVIVLMALWWYRMGLVGFGGLFVVFMALFLSFGLAIAITRCRAEGGLAITSTAAINNKLIIEGIGHASVLAPDNVKGLAHNEWMSIATLPNLLAAQIEGLYMANRLRIKPRVVAIAAGVAFAVSVVVGLLSYLVLTYLHGGMKLDQRFYSGMTVVMWKIAGDLVHRQSDIKWVWCAMIPFGAILMGALLFIRKIKPKFPLPPICLLIVTLGTVGFQTGMDALHRTYTAGPYVCFIWGPFLIAYIIKKLVLRFGGMDLYVRALPAALGLICGQCLMIVFWNIFHAVTNPENVGVFTGVFQ